MSELAAFEELLKQKYSCEVELLHSKDVQNIVDHANFDLDEIRHALKATYVTGPKYGFLDTYFRVANMKTVATLFDISKKLRFIYCNEGIVPFVFVFYAHQEKEHYSYLVKLEKLKVFL